MSAGCGVVECERELLARGLCGRHYARLRRTGSTDVGERLVGADLVQRLWFRSSVAGECWVSARALTRRVREGGDGYPGIKVQGVMVPVHLAAYRHLVGEPPAGHHVHHLCGTKRCWRPEHLVALSPAAHKAAHRKRVCVNGHALEGENVRAGRCRACSREYLRSYRRRAHRSLVAS